jgi:hypothetical protein
LTDTLRELGVVPDGIIGHSTGNLPNWIRNKIGLHKLKALVY